VPTTKEVGDALVMAGPWRAVRVNCCTASGTKRHGGVIVMANTAAPAAGVPEGSRAVCLVRRSDPGRQRAGLGERGPLGNSMAGVTVKLPSSPP